MDSPTQEISQTDGQELERVKQSFAAWRAVRQPGARIPQQLWQAACSLYPRYAIIQIVRALRLDYVDLRKRIEGDDGRESATRGPDSAAFLAIPGMPPAAPGEDSVPSGAEVVVRLREGRRVRIRIRLKGVSVGSLVELLRGVWSRG